MNPLAILVTGDPSDRVRRSRGSYADIIRANVADVFGGPVIEVDLRNGAALPAPATLFATVVTGSSSSVTERSPWMLRAEEYLRVLTSASVPTLGICFGHQLLGQALGGEVSKNPSGREIGTVELDLLVQDPLFGRATAPYRVNATHVDTVSRLPPGALVLARTRLERHAAVRFTETTWGVQFHPEVDAYIMRDFLEGRRALIDAEGLDAAALLEEVDDAPAGASMLTQFIEMFR